jgi:hypothetical protein
VTTLAIAGRSVSSGLALTTINAAISVTIAVMALKPNPMTRNPAGSGMAHPLFAGAARPPDRPAVRLWTFL